MSKSVITTSLALVLAMTMVLAVGKTRSGEEEVSVQPRVQVAIPIEESVDIITRTAAVSTPGPQLTVEPDVEPGEVILDNQAVAAVEGEDALMVSLAQVQEALNRLQRLAQQTERAVSALEQQL